VSKKFACAKITIKDCAHTAWRSIFGLEAIYSRLLGLKNIIETINFCKIRTLLEKLLQPKFDALSELPDLLT
jgi:hypothetical protein